LRCPKRENSQGLHERLIPRETRRKRSTSTYKVFFKIAQMWAETQENEKIGYLVKQLRRKIEREREVCATSKVFMFLLVVV
jgi:hypothetical protein